MVKVTFTLDETTVNRLGQTAQRLDKPKSEVVREAIREYHAKSGRLSDAERKRALEAIDQISAKPPSRSQKAVDREIALVRETRRLQGRGHVVK